MIDANTITTSDIAEIRKLLAKADAETVVFIDIDDTVITPVSLAFRSKKDILWKNPIDKIKDKKADYPNYNEIISNWRIARKSELVSQEWVSIIDSLKRQGVPFYALTQVDTGKIGCIESMEEWRYNELKEKAIEFTPTFNSMSVEQLLPTDGKGTCAVFYKGLFMTGPFKKSQLIEAIHSRMLLAKIIMIDDKREQVEDIAKICEHYGIDCTGVIYRGIELLLGIADPAIVSFQEKQLQEGLWFEDDAARKALHEEQQKRITVGRS